MLSNFSENISNEKPYAISANFLQKCIENNEPIHQNSLKSIILGETKENLLKLSREIESEKNIINSGLLKFKAKHANSENFKETRKFGVHSIDKSQNIKELGTKIAQNLDHLVDNFMGVLNEIPKNKSFHTKGKKTKKKKPKKWNFLKNTLPNEIQFIKPEIYNESIKLMSNKEKTALRKEETIPKNSEKKEEESNSPNLFKTKFPQENKKIEQKEYIKEEPLKKKDLIVNEKPVTFENLESKKNEKEKLILNFPIEKQQPKILQNNINISKGLQLNFEEPHIKKEENEIDEYYEDDFEVSEASPLK